MTLDDTQPAEPPVDRFGFLHVDLNSFFASVEQELHPEYRGRPLAVCATMSDTGTIIAASYEAKAKKVTTGTKIGDAKKLCPGIVLVEGRHTKYAEFSHNIVKAVERVCPVAHVPSIDEVVCQLMGRECEPPRARQIALGIKQAIREDVGSSLRCSIGMAPNRYLAKIASDMQKPDGLIGLLPSQLPKSIEHLELRDLPGVGARMEANLNRKGIDTMRKLLALDRPGMRKLWDSVWGDRLYHWLRGHDTGDDGAPVSSGLQKSLGHSHVLGPEFRTVDGAWAVAHKLVHKAAMRLRLEGFYTTSLSFNIRFALSSEQVARVERRQKVKRHSSGIEHASWGMEARFAPCQDTLTLLQALQGIWQQCPRGADQQRPFFVAVTLHNLMREGDVQPGLFGDTDRRGELASTMDMLNKKFGHTTVHFAGMLPARESAPTRIAFTQIPVKYGAEWM